MGTNFLYQPQSPIKLLSPRRVFGIGKSVIAATFTGSVRIMPSPMMCPKFRSRLMQKWPWLTLIVKTALLMCTANSLSTSKLALIPERSSELRLHHFPLLSWRFINNISRSFCCPLCATFAVRLVLVSVRSSELRSRHLAPLSRCTINNISWSFCCPLCATFTARLALISARSSELRSDTNELSASLGIALSYMSRRIHSSLRSSPSLSIDAISSALFGWPSQNRQIIYIFPIRLHYYSLERRSQPAYKNTYEYVAQGT